MRFIFTFLSVCALNYIGRSLQTISVSPSNLVGTIEWAYNTFSDSDLIFVLAVGTYTVSASPYTKYLTSVKLQAASPPSGQPTDCSVLPTIKFSGSGNFFYFPGVGTTSFVGITITADGYTRISPTSGNQKYIFSSSCIVEDDTATANGPFFSGAGASAASTVQLEFTNSIVVKKTKLTSVFVLNDASFKWMNSKISITNNLPSDTQPMISLYGASSSITSTQCIISAGVGATTADIDGFEVVSGSGSTYIPPILVVKQFQTVTLKKVSILNIAMSFTQTSSLTPFNPSGRTCGSMLRNGAFIVDNCANVDITNWLISGTSWTSADTRNLGWALLRITNAGKLTTSGSVQFDNSIWTDNGNFPSFLIKIIRGQLHDVTTFTFTIPELMINSSQITGQYFRAISVTNTQNLPAAYTDLNTVKKLNTYTFSAFTVLNSSVSNAYSLYEIELIDYRDGTNNRAFASSTCTLNSFSLIDSSLINTRIANMILTSWTIPGAIITDYSIESSARTWLKFSSYIFANSNITNNAVSGTIGQLVLIKVPSFAWVQASNFTISDCNFTSVTLIGAMQLADHLFLTNATITNNIFTSMSLLYQAPQFLSAMQYHPDIFTLSGMLTSVRTFLLNNIDSEENVLDSSTLFQSATPRVYVRNCTFKEKSLKQSVLFSGGNYVPLLPSELASVTFTVDTVVESLLSTANVNILPGIMSTLYQLPYNLTLVSTPRMIVQVETVTFSVSDFMQSSSIISISDYNTTNSMIYIRGASFTDLYAQVLGSGSSNKLISLSNVYYGRAYENTFGTNLAGSMSFIHADKVLLAFEFLSNNVDGLTYTAATDGPIPKGLVSFTNINRFVAYQNNFKNVIAPIFAFSITEMLIGTSDSEIKSTTLETSQNLGFVSIVTSYMSNFVVSSNKFTDIDSIESTLVIQVGNFTGTITLHENRFDNFNMLYPASTYLNYYFFDVEVFTNNLETSLVEVTNNLFEIGDIQIATADRSIFLSSFIKLAVLDTNLTVSGNTINNVKVGQWLRFFDISGTNATVTGLTITTSEMHMNFGMLSVNCQGFALSSSNFNDIIVNGVTDGSIIMIKGFAGSSGLIQASITNCNFNTITSGSAGVISIQSGLFNATLSGLTFQSIQAVGGPFIYLYNSVFGNLLMTQVTFYNTQDLYQAIVQATNADAATDGQIMIVDNTLYETSTSSSIFFLITNSSGVNLTSNSIKNSVTTDPPLVTQSSFLVQYSGSVNLIQNFNDINVTGPSLLQVDCYGAYDLSLFINGSESSDVQLVNATASLITVRGSNTCLKNVSINGSVFTGLANEGGNGSLVNIRNGSLFQLNILNSNFSNNSAQFGGLVYSNSTNPDSSIYINSSNFTNNTAIYRAAVLMAPIDYTVATDCIFVDNDAYISGAVFFVNVLDKEKGNLNNTSNVFANNSVSLSMNPDISTQAKYFTIQFHPIDLQLLVITESKLDNGTALLTNVSSWSLQNVTMTITTFDYLDQPYYDVSQDTELKFTTEYSGTENKTVNSYNCSAGGCYVTSNTILFNGDPLTRLLTYVDYVSTTGSLQNRFVVQLRDCVIGEIVNHDTKTCLICPVGKYSLNLSDPYCKNCPEGAYCSGGRNITPLVNYYQSLIVRDSILPCWTEDERCKGGDDNECAEGYYGPLCQLCRLDLGYNGLDDGECRKCGSFATSMAVSVLSILGNFVVQIFIVYATWDNNHKVYRTIVTKGEMDEDIGSYMRQLTTYFQIMTILSTLSPKMFNGMEFMQTISNPVGSLSFYFDCVYLDGGWTAEDIMKMRLFFLVGSVGAQFVMTIAGLVVIKLIKKKFALKNAIYSASLAIYLNNQPPIMDGLSSYMNCIKLDPNDDPTYVSTYLNVRCDTESYASFKMKFLVPLIVVINAVLPIVLLAILIVKHKYLNEEKYRMALGAIYNDFKGETFYWCLVLVLFKVILVVIAQLTEFTTGTKSVLLLVSILGYAIIFIRKNPYYEDSLKKCEWVGIACYMAGVVFAMLLLENPSMELATQIIFYIVSAFCTVFIMFFILRIYYRQIKELIQKWKDPKKGKRTPQRNTYLIGSQKSPPGTDITSARTARTARLDLISKAASLASGRRHPMVARKAKVAQLEDSHSSTNSFSQNSPPMMPMGDSGSRESARPMKRNSKVEMRPKQKKPVISRFALDETQSSVVANAHLLAKANMAGMELVENRAELRVNFNEDSSRLDSSKIIIEDMNGYPLIDDSKRSFLNGPPPTDSARQRQTARHPQPQSLFYSENTPQLLAAHKQEAFRKKFPQYFVA